MNILRFTAGASIRLFLRRPVSWLCVLTFGSALLAQIAHAQNYTWTQVGTVQGGLKSNGAQPPTFNWYCPDVTFPQEFGATPNVIVSFSTLFPVAGSARSPEVFVDVKATNVTTKGFTPVISSPIESIGLGTYPLTISWTAVGPFLLNGTATAKYMVLTVIYAPPGTNGGKSSSSIVYGSGSTTGTTTSASQSFKVANSISWNAEVGILGNGGGVGLSFDWSHSNTDSQSLEIKKSLTSTINWTGPAQDGVNHDEDVIYLLLNPTIDLAISPSSAAWLLSNTNSQSPIQYVHVGWLNGHQPMPPGVAAALQSAGITSRDYPDIMARDPLANGSSTLDPARFVLLNTTFPYEPPYAAGDPVPTITTAISDSSTATSGTATEDDYKVGLSITQVGSYFDLAKATLKDTASLEWTNKSSQSSATGTTQSASVTVGGPSYGYTGPTLMKVYIDTVYQTFAFAIVPVALEELSVRGTVKGADGNPMAATE